MAGETIITVVGNLTADPEIRTIPGIYRTWSECQKQVTGYPGAVFKGL